MKKLIILAFVFIILSLAGCGASNPSNPDPGTAGGGSIAINGGITYYNNNGGLGGVLLVIQDNVTNQRINNAVVTINTQTIASTGSNGAYLGTVTGLSLGSPVAISIMVPNKGTFSANTAIPSTCPIITSPASTTPLSPGNWLNASINTISWTWFNGIPNLPGASASMYFGIGNYNNNAILMNATTLDIPANTILTPPFGVSLNGGTLGLCIDIPIQGVVALPGTPYAFRVIAGDMLYVNVN